MLPSHMRSVKHDRSRALSLDARCGPCPGPRRAPARCAAPPARASAGAAARAAARPYPNPLGVHSLVWCGEWNEETATAAAKGSAAAGFDLVEIPAFDAARLDGKMTKRVLAEHGLVAATSLGLTLDADISSDDKEVVARGVAALEDALRFSADAGARHMCGILYSALEKYPRPPTASGRANAAAALRGLAAKAEDLGVALCLEVVNRYETNLLNTAAQAAEFIDEVNHPNVFIHLDTYHMHIEEVSMAAAVAAAGDRLRYIHIGECHRGYLGTGSVDFQGLFEALAAAGYRGPLTFESFSSAVVNEQLSNTLCVWRDLWSDSLGLALHARDYVDASWRAALVGAGGYRGAGRSRAGGGGGGR